MDHSSPIVGELFGQEERLTVRLRGLVRAYPRSVGIVKEFLQNADDAGATWLRVILDEREHPRGRLPDPRMAGLQGPALLVASDQVFSAADLDAIRRLGETSKATQGPKTGRFGLGFNTAYNVTDHPSFVSGPWAVAFDPHRRALAGDGGGTGRRWTLAELGRGAPDWLAAFAGGGLAVDAVDHPATIFRLPLRDAAQAACSEICDEPFEPVHFEQMLRDLTDAGDELLLFARHVLDLQVERIDPDGARRVLLRISTVDPDAVSAVRAVGNAAVAGDIADNLAAWRGGHELARATYRHTLAVTTPARVELRPWQVAAGLFVDELGELLDLNAAMVRLHEKAIPWAGAAVRLEARDDGGVAVAAQHGRLFCTFPLADQPAALPFHCNACFDLDAARRGLSLDESAYAEADRVRVAWNQALLRHAVPQAAALAIAALVPDAAAAGLGRFYALWPDPGADGPWRGLFVATLALLAERPLVRTRAGADVAWRSLAASQLPPALFGPDLQEALRDDGLPLPDPELPAWLVRAAEAAGVPTRRYRPAELRAWLRRDDPLGVPMAAAPLACLRERPHIVDLLQFCLSDRKDDVAGLPLALTGDERVRTFGRAGELLLADAATRRLFADHPAWFIDAGVQQNTRLQRCEAAQLREMTPAQVVARLGLDLALGPGETRAWDPDGEAPPNAAWIEQALRYLADRVPPGREPGLARLALLPDARGRLHCAGDATLLLAAEELERPLQAALARLGVDLVGGGPDVLAAVRVFQRHHPGSIAGMTGPSLARRLPAAREALASLADERAALLDYLAAPRWLDLYGPDELAALVGLPLLRTSAGRVVRADQPGVHLQGTFRPPPLIDADVEFVDVGPGERWRALIERLGVPVLELGQYVADVLVPGYPSGDPELQRAALLWLRDEVDRAALERDAPGAVARLRAAPLVLAVDGRLRRGDELYLADDGPVGASPELRAAVPDMNHYRGDAARWRSLFTWIGVADQPPAGLLLRDLDLLIDRYEEDREAARRGLAALFVHVHRRWSTLSADDVALLTAGLRRRAWLPACVAPPRAVAGFTAASDRLHRPDELYLPDDLERIAGQGPVLAAPIDAVDPAMAAALGFRAPGPEALLARLELLRSMWDAEDHAGLTAEAVTAATTAIYAALADLDPPAAATRRPCVWDPARRRFWRPAHAFAVPVVDLFGGLRGHVAGDREEVRRGLARLGRREAPGPDDIVAALVELRDAHADDPLDEDGVTLVLRLLRRLLDARLADDVRAAVPVPTRTGHLQPVAAVRVDDAPWFSARIPGDALAYVHPRVGVDVLDHLGVRRLSTCTREEVAERPALSGDGDRVHFCERLTATLHDPAFTAGLARILVDQGAMPDGGLDMIADLRIVAVDRLVTQLRVAGLAAPVGRAEVPVFADAELDVVYVRGDPWDGLVVQISEAINRILDGALRNLAHLEAILRTDPAEVVALLDQRRVPRLHTPQPVRARPAATGEAASVLTHDRVAAVAFDDGAAPGPTVAAAAIGLVVAAERAAGREPTATARNHPAYDLQVGDGVDARYIRVIGLDGAWDRVTVAVPARHYNAARVFGRNFWLYVVEHALDPTAARIHRIYDPVSRVARFVFDHGWRVQGDQRGAAADGHLGWWHLPPGGEPGRIEAVETIGTFLWLRVRRLDDTTERRFFKPACDRLLPPEAHESTPPGERLAAPPS